MRRFFLFSIIALAFATHEDIFSTPLNITISAKAAILINAENGKVLFSKNPDKKFPPASITKIASCLVALKKNTNFEEVVECSRECLIKIPQKIKRERGYQDPPYRLEPDGKSYGIYTGERLTIKDLLYGMMLHSANDASNVVAYHYSNGNIDSYMEEVNEYLRSVGCTNSTFYNPHGLHYPKHMTTARDMAILGREAIKNPEFLDIVKTTNYERPKTNKQPARTIWNGNKLLLKGIYYYPKAFGIKTGYHAAAGFTFVGAAKDENRTLISVVLGCRNYDEAFKDSIKIFNKAFEEKKLTRQLLNQKESVFTTKVKGTAKILKAYLQEDLSIHYFLSEEEVLKPYLSWDDLKLPIKKGQKVGEIHVKTEQGEIVKVGYLQAFEDINIVFLHEQIHRLFSFSTIIYLMGLIGVMLIFKYYRKRLSLIN